MKALVAAGETFFVKNLEHASVDAASNGLEWKSVFQNHKERKKKKKL